MAREVYEALLSSILSGRIARGTFLSQVEIARDLGVSRTPVREALRRLQENGLVNGEPNFRCCVLGLDPEEIESLYIKRLLLEQIAVSQASVNATATQLTDMRAAVRQLELSAGEARGADWVAAKMRLLDTLQAKLTAPLRNELSLIQQRCVRYETDNNRGIQSRRAEVLAYRETVDAIARGEPDIAATRISQLLMNQATHMLASIAPEFDLGPLAAVKSLLKVPAQIRGDGNPSRNNLSRVDPLEIANLAQDARPPRVLPKSVRGRPSDPGKREAILGAARDLFLTYGPSSVTMDRLADQAGVAKATLYACFEDKNAVLVEMVRRESELAVSDQWKSQREGGLEESLIAFGVAFLTFMVNPQLQSLERLLSGIAIRDPALGDRLFVAGPGRAMNILRALLAEAEANGQIRADSIDTAAEDLLGLWQGFLRVDVNFHQMPNPQISYLRDRAAHGVRQFLKLYGAEGDPREK